MGEGLGFGGGGGGRGAFVGLGGRTTCLDGFDASGRGLLGGSWVVLSRDIRRVTVPYKPIYNYP